MFIHINSHLCDIHFYGAHYAVISQVLEIKDTSVINLMIDDVALTRDTSLTHLLQNIGRHDDNHEDHDIAIVKHSYYTTDDFTNT